MQIWKLRDIQIAHSQVYGGHYLHMKIPTVCLIAWNVLSSPTMHFSDMDNFAVKMVDCKCKTPEKCENVCNINSDIGELVETVRVLQLSFVNIVQYTINPA